MIRWHEIPRSPPPRTLRQFAALCVVIFGGAAAWRWSRAGAFDLRTALLALGGLAGAAGLARPALIRPLFVGWLMLTFPVGWAVSRIILLVMFFGIFTPIALLFRMTGRDALQLRRGVRRDSYWIPKRPPTGESYYRQF
jgi:hypothetical protein